MRDQAVFVFGLVEPTAGTPREKRRFRHSAATLMLRSGVLPAEVARRLGHSVDVLMRTYAGILTDELDRSNTMIELEIDRQLD